MQKIICKANFFSQYSGETNFFSKVTKLCTIFINPWSEASFFFCKISEANFLFHQYFCCHTPPSHPILSQFFRKWSFYTNSSRYSEIYLEKTYYILPCLPISNALLTIYLLAKNFMIYKYFQCMMTVLDKTFTSI